MMGIEHKVPKLLWAVGLLVVAAFSSGRREKLVKCYNSVPALLMPSSIKRLYAPADTDRIIPCRRTRYQ